MELVEPEVAPLEKGVSVIRPVSFAFIGSSGLQDVLFASQVIVV